MPIRVAHTSHLEAVVRQQHRNQTKLEALRAKIATASSSGAPKPADEVFARLESKYRARVADAAHGSGR